MPKFVHILIVDDDSDVREVLRHMLDEFGYRVSLAENGVTARPVLDRRDVDLLITDVIMFGESGRRLAEYARSLGVPALLMSADNKVKRELEGTYPDFIGKPFRLAKFHEEVIRVLAKPKGGVASIGRAGGHFRVLERLT